MPQIKSESVELLCRIANATPALIAHVDRDQRYVFVNSTYAEQFNRTPDEIVGECMSRIVGEETYAIVRPHLECALRGEDTQRHEFELRVPGTVELKAMEATYATHFGADGTVTACTTLIFDVTERKAAEGAVKSSEAHLRHALDASGAGVWAWDADTGVITADGAYRAMYGIAPDATVDTETWEARLHPDDREPLKQRAEECLRGGSQWREEFRVLHPQYGTRWLAGLGRVVRNAEGRVSGITGINIDITAQKAAETAVAESEAHLKAVVEGAIDGIIAMDNDGAVQSLNAAAATMFGVVPAEIIGQNARLLIPQFLASDFLKPSSTDDAKATSVTHELVGRRKDGSVFPLDLGVTEVSRDGNRLVIGIVRDITERKQAEEAQRLLIDELKRMAGGADYQEASEGRTDRNFPDQAYDPILAFSFGDYIKASRDQPYGIVFANWSAASAAMRQHFLAHGKLASPYW